MVIYSGFFPLKMVIFHSYVKLPEGNNGEQTIHKHDDDLGMIDGIEFATVV